MRWFLLFILSGVLTELKADPILVGIHYGQAYLRATISVQKGTYAVTAGDQTLFVYYAGQSLDLTASSGKVNVFYDGTNYTSNKRIELIAMGESSFSITPAGQKKSPRIYQENLIAFEYSGRLQLVNEIELEDYVSGVIEAESGSGNELEYYKVQAVISRTYALNNKTRHLAEGYQLCDATHCQVYHGKPRAEPMAEVASFNTRDIVIVDADINLITAAFHSNCGGKTVNAQDVWSKPLSYCESRTDSFCLVMPHSNWEKTIPLERWNNYLESKRSDFEIDPKDSASYLPYADRQYFVADSTMRIPLRVMREDLKLKSTSFRMSKVNDQVKFTGQGFGHGVGLCQEGAMRMAQLDYCYEAIIHFYYKDVHLIPRYMMWFFQE
jgi:stage II sporulation protein D